MGSRRGWGRAALVAVLVPSLAVTPALLRPAPAGAAALPPGFSDPATRDADLARLVRSLEGRVVAAHLRGLGLDAQTAAARLARLDDAELHRLAQAASEAGIGGDERERMWGTILLYVVALVVFAGLIYFAAAGF